jgi:hypothetical protein
LLGEKRTNLDERFFTEAYEIFGKPLTIDPEGVDEVFGCYAHYTAHNIL